MQASIASLSALSKISSTLGVSFPFCKMRSNRETMHSSGTWIKETSKEVSDAKQSRHSSLNEGGCGKICEVATFMRNKSSTETGFSSDPGECII
jgi:hypothetical protein